MRGSERDCQARPGTDGPPPYLINHPTSRLAPSREHRLSLCPQPLPDLRTCGLAVHPAVESPVTQQVSCRTSAWFLWPVLCVGDISRVKPVGRLSWKRDIFTADASNARYLIR